MNLSDQLLSAFVSYGLPVLFGVVVAASVGAPLPASLLLITAGAFSQSGDLNYAWVVVAAVLGAVLGDNVGYGIGRWGGRHMATRLSRWFGGPQRLAQAEAAAARYGGAGIFLSRWLLSPIGPAINLTSGLAVYAWPKFVLWDLLGELLWVGLYTLVGRIFSDQVQIMSDLLGSIAGALVGVAATSVLGVLVIRQFRSPRPPRSAPAAMTDEHESHLA